jgi:hypothetical protein
MQLYILIANVGRDERGQLQKYVLMHFNIKTAQYFTPSLISTFVVSSYGGEEDCI